MKFDERVEEICKEIPEEDRADLLTFIRLFVRVPGFREELHALAAPDERIPPLEVTESLMEKWKGRLVTE